VKIREEVKWGRNPYGESSDRLQWMIRKNPLLKSYVLGERFKPSDLDSQLRTINNRKAAALGWVRSDGVCCPRALVRQEIDRQDRIVRKDRSALSPRPQNNTTIRSRSFRADWSAR